LLQIGRGQGGDNQADGFVHCAFKTLGRNCGALNQGVTAMTHPTAHPKPHASPWAVGLLFISSAFALIAIVLFSTVHPF